MKLSEHWLRTFCDPALSTAELAHALTMAGLEVEEVEPAAAPFEGVVVGKVLTVDGHPDAEKLKVCTVDIGRPDALSIVCGAPNVTKGIKVACATVGARLPGLQIKEAKLRGVQSQGMLCSAAELGISEDHAGLIVLDPEANVGSNVRQVLDLDDNVFSLKLTANRGDCLSLLGIGRELAAITGAALCLPSLASAAPALTETLDVTLSSPEACPRYAGLVLRGVNAAAPTPQHVVRRLERSGVRAISAIVDLTNYVMLEIGQPMHAFDLAKLQGSIDVRFARRGERLELLNGQVLDLEPDMLVICDGRGPVALAGIMGGEQTAVTVDTTDVFLESAFFTPGVIAGKWRRLGFSTDASHRYERGVDYEGCRRAVERLSGLILEVCGGKSSVVSDVVAELPTRPEVQLRFPRVQRILGMDVSAERVKEILGRLDMPVRQTGDVMTVTAPSYRFDISIEEDLVAEIVRIEGYEKLPATLPEAKAGTLAMPERFQGMSQLRQTMVTRDFQEVVTYSFVDEAWERDFAGNSAPLRLANPIAEQLSVMRSSLLASLVDCLRFNTNRKQARVRLFEISQVFAAHAEGFDQRLRLGALAYGDAKPEQWGAARRPVDFFDLRGDLETLFGARHVEFVAAPHPALHPGKSAQVVVDQTVVGWIGELHPGLLTRYEVQGNVVAFEVDARTATERPVPVFREFSKFPLVRRDIAVEVAEDIPARSLLKTMQDSGDPILDDVALFDVYR
ncbi:MAG: phenylalanyl-tRNA synthetase subunit beta, partial [Betaproteobacteria bacterium SG8_40]